MIPCKKYQLLCPTFHHFSFDAAYFLIVDRLLHRQFILQQSHAYVASTTFTSCNSKYNKLFLVQHHFHFKYVSGEFRQVVVAQKSICINVFENCIIDKDDNVVTNGEVQNTSFRIQPTMVKSLESLFQEKECILLFL